MTDLETAISQVRSKIARYSKSKASINPHHHQCVAGDWDFLTKYTLKVQKKTNGKATEITNQIKDF